MVNRSKVKRIGGVDSVNRSIKAPQNTVSILLFSKKMRAKGQLSVGRGG